MREEKTLEQVMDQVEQFIRDVKGMESITISNSVIDDAIFPLSFKAADAAQGSDAIKTRFLTLARQIRDVSHSVGWANTLKEAGHYERIQKHFSKFEVPNFGDINTLTPKPFEPELP